MRLVPSRVGLALVSFALANVALPICADAQQVPALRAGQRVRVSTHQHVRHVGELRSISRDTIIIAVPAPGGIGSTEITLLKTDVRQLETSVTGPRRSHAGTGLLFGAALGAVVGYAVTANASCSGCDSPGSIGVMVFAPVGAIVGLVAGATTGRELWTRVAWPAA